MEPWTRREALAGLGAAALVGCPGRRGAGGPVVAANDNVAMDGPAAGAAEVRALLIEHARRYPEMEPGDLYKLLMQRSMGPEHWVNDDEALAWLQREAAALAPLPTGVEAVDVELLDSGRGLARVHLRPWLVQGRSLEALATAFAATSARWTPQPDGTCSPKPSDIGCPQNGVQRGPRVAMSPWRLS